MEGLFIALGIILFLGIVFLVWWFSTKNNFVRYGVKIDEASSGIDVALTKRYDLLTKSLAVVKGYAEHEKATLAEVVKLRKPAANATMDEKSEFANKMNAGYEKISVLAEAYPELKANTNFVKLQEQITDSEEQLQAARRVYNSNVANYNTYLQVFPSSIVANAMKLTKKDMFKAEEAKKQDVEIKF